MAEGHGIQARQRLADLDDNTLAAGRARVAMLEALPAGELLMFAKSAKLGRISRAVQRRRNGGCGFQQTRGTVRSSVAHYLKHIADVWGGGLVPSGFG